MQRESIIRAVAGSLVSLSLILGWWWHPAFFLVTAFVGVNLLQSAFTRFCPLEGILKHYRIGA